MSRVTKSADDAYDVFKNTDIRDNVKDETKVVKFREWSDLV